MTDISFIDLFAGLGGTRIGFEQACTSLGFSPKCVFTSEKKKTAISAYSKNFPNANISGDIVNIETKDIPPFDYLLGGFPCQPFSKAGSKKGFADTRGTMFFEIERILYARKPKGFILENVEGLVTHDKGNTLSTIVSHLEKLEYHVSWKVLSGSDFGLAQDRRRIYIVGDKKKKIDLDSFPAYEHTVFGQIQEHGKAGINSAFTHMLLSAYSPAKLFGKQIIDKRGGNNVIHSWDFDMKGRTTAKQKELLSAIMANQRRRKFAEELGIAWRDGMPLNVSQIASFCSYPKLESDLEYLASKGYLIKQHPYKDGSQEFREDLPIGYKLMTSRLSYEFNRILDPEDICVTLTATDSSKIGVLDNGRIRGLTTRECLRLFGFPESYSLDGFNMPSVYDLCGNSICIPVVDAIARKLISK